MKKIVIFYCLLAISFTSFGQELTLNKAETVVFLTKQFKLAEGRALMKPDEALTIKNCKLSFSRGMLTISYSMYEDNKLYKTTTVFFSPLHITSISNRSEEKTAEPGALGEMWIYFDPNRSHVHTKIFSEPNEYDSHREFESLYYFYDAGNGFDDFQKALLHLKKLLQAEADPYEQSDSEKRLAILFSKYKTIETVERPTESYGGSKILAEDMLLSLDGPCASYSRVVSRTMLQGGNKSKQSMFSDFWWYKINYIKYNVVAGGLLIKGTDKGTGKTFEYKSVDLLTNKPFKGQGSDMVALFKPAVADMNGDTKKDVLEIISLIKKIVKEYGGENVTVEINEK